MLVPNYRDLRLIVCIGESGNRSWEVNCKGVVDITLQMRYLLLMEAVSEWDAFLIHSRRAARIDLEHLRNTAHGILTALLNSRKPIEC
jgi:hypothetical protein